MKTKKLLFLSIILLLYIFPLATVAEEIRTNVLIVIKPDKILAFSGRNKNWVPPSLKLKERVQLKSEYN